MILNPYRFGSGGPNNFINVMQQPAPLSGRYMRILLRSHSLNVGSASEIVFRDAPAGASINGAGTAIGSFTDVVNCFDGNTNTFGFGSTGQTVGLDLGSGNSGAPAAFLWTNRNTAAAENQQAIRSGIVEVSSDNATWTKSWSTWTHNVWDTAAESVELTRPVSGLLLDARAAFTTDQVGGGTISLLNGATGDVGAGWWTLDGVDDSVNVAIRSQTGNRDDWSLEFHTEGMVSGDEGSLVTLEGPNIISAYRTGTNPSALSLYIGGGTNFIQTADGLIDGSVQHWAIVKSSGVWKIYLNGESVTMVDDILVEERFPQYNAICYIGNDSVGRRVAGKIGRVLIWDFARYTGSFTPPAVTDVPLYEIS